jgi:hypothetical protein
MRKFMLDQTTTDDEKMRAMNFQFMDADESREVGIFIVLPTRTVGETIVFGNASCSDQSGRASYVIGTEQ